MNAKTTSPIESKGIKATLRANGAKFNISFFLWSDESNIKQEEILPWVKRALNTTEMSGPVSVVLGGTIHHQTVKRVAHCNVVDHIVTGTSILSELTKLRNTLDNVKHMGEYHIAIVGRRGDLESIIEYCNAIYCYDALNTVIPPKDRPEEMDQFSFFWDGRAEAHEFQCYRRVFNRTLCVQSILSTATVQWYLIPGTTTTTVALNVGSFNIAVGLSHAAPTTDFSQRLGIEYAKENAIIEAKEYLGSMFAFHSHMGLDPKPRFERYNIWDMADFTTCLVTKK